MTLIDMLHYNLSQKKHSCYECCDNSLLLQLEQALLELKSWFFTTVRA